MHAVVAEDRRPKRKPAMIFYRRYWPEVVGRISLTKTTPSSFLEMMFMALNVQPMNMVMIRMSGRRIPRRFSRMSGRSRTMVSAYAACSRCLQGAGRVALSLSPAIAVRIPATSVFMLMMLVEGSLMAAVSAFDVS